MISTLNAKELPDSDVIKTLRTIEEGLSTMKGCAMAQFNLGQKNRECQEVVRRVLSDEIPL